MEIIEIVGILIGFVGLVVLYKYNNSPTGIKSNQVYLYDDDEAELLDVEDAKIDAKYKRMRDIGFWLTVASFVIGVFCRFA